ncbi:hypothetical protein DN585_03765 [Intrasporangium calvum]|nr:hypothetical protein DN585_03765 [Intrasporangium calvum]
MPKEKELPPSAESARAAAAVARVEAPRSAATLEQLQHDAIDMGAQFTEEDVWLSQADPEHDRVVISVVTASDELIAEMASRYGRSVAVHVDADRPVSLPQFGRQSDGSPFWGGAWIIGCTDAFTETYNGGYYMLTAGHCRPTGGTVSTPETSMGTVTQSSRENWNSGTGTVLMSGGGSTYRGDIAQIAMYSSKSGQGYIYRGSSSSTSGKPVRGMASQVVNGDPYCTGGSVSGEICGWTVRYPRTDHRYSNGELARNVAVSYSKQGWCTRPGDSGGPIYIVNSDGSVRARGIHSGGGGGGSDYYGGSLDQCFEVFTDIWDPYYAFPGTLLTS